MPFCPNCGKEVSEGVTFCPECGQRLKQAFTPEERQKYIDELKASVEEEPAKKTGITKKKLAGIIIGCVIVVFVVIGVATSLGEPTPTPIPPPTEQPTPPTISEEGPLPPSKPATFAAITITGTGDKTSRPFTVTTQEWTIAWSYTSDDPEFAVFSFFIYPRGETAFFVESVSFPEGTSGSTYSYAGPGEYYLKVITGNIKSWKVVIKPA